MTQREWPHQPTDGSTTANDPIINVLFNFIFYTREKISRKLPVSDFFLRAIGSINGIEQHIFIRTLKSSGNIAYSAMRKLLAFFFFSFGRTEKKM